MRWLEKVRRRLNAPKDLLHESVWIGKSKGILDDTLKYLKELSGYGMHITIVFSFECCFMDILIIPFVIYSTYREIR
jgi:hypothetical protein